MLSSEFVGNYDREHAQEPWVPDDLYQVIQPAQKWAMDYGRVLHDTLQDSPMDERTGMDFHMGYTNWLFSSLVSTNHRINSGPWSMDDKLAAHSAMQFHVLNRSMAALWLLNTQAEVDHRSRRQLLTFAQDNLALFAIHTYFMRERETSVKQSFSYFDESNSERKALIEGALNEIDSAIVLIEIAKRNDLNVVPAPPQFERTGKPKRNVDFVVLRGLEAVVGVQVKSRVTNENAVKYDPSIVLIDANVDLDNQLARRTEAKRSTVRSVGWAGLIAAHQLLSIPKFARKDSQRLIFEDPSNRQRLLQLKMHTNQLVRNIPSKIPQATERIGSRILEKFDGTSDVTEVTSAQ